MLSIFDVSAVAEQLPAEDIMLKRGGCIAYLCPCGAAPARNTLRLQDVWISSQENSFAYARLVMKVLEINNVRCAGITVKIMVNRCL